MFKLKRYAAVPLVASALLLTACGAENTTVAEQAPAAVATPAQAEMTDQQLEQLVNYSYPYVALYNVINKTAVVNGGWNSYTADTRLKDHTLQSIARPNNDTLYVGGSFDLRKDPLIIESPALESRYVSLLTSAYDHIVDIPLSTTYGTGDFTKVERIAFYSARTEGYNGEPIEGVDRVIELSGDFPIIFMRVMPHAAEPEKFERITQQMKDVSFKTLSEYRGGEAKSIDDIEFPAFGKTDADIYANNFLEVMQFVFNHSTFDESVEFDRKALAAMKQLGVEPGKSFDAATAPELDTVRLLAAVEKVRLTQLQAFVDPANANFEFQTSLFKPKDELSLQAHLVAAVVGPVGQPAHQAMYPAVATADGQPMNAQHDYVVRMSADELPPVNAFWSVTLYDEENGFFIPNDHYKYSVGENGGFELDADGGIEIHVAAEQPEGVPAANWLPINRKDEGLSLVMRLYGPDLEKVQDWTAPVAERVK